MALSDIIQIIGVAVSATGVGVAIWLAVTIEKSVTAERILKDILIKQIDDISQKHTDFFNKLLDGNVEPKKILSWFQMFNIEAMSLMDKIRTMYPISEKYLYPYQYDFREIITNDKSFEEQFNKMKLEPSTSLKNQLYRFKKENHHLFLDLICEVNTAKRKRVRKHR